MFAGAVRETVFSRPDVIQRVSNEFVPVALKAALINNPPGGRGSIGVEGAYLAEVGRTKAAPQGIVAANKHGRILAWVLNFDDADQIPAFLDYVLEQHAKHPGPEPFDTPRFMHFPSRPMASVPAIDNVFPELARHGAGEFCPATPPKPRGTIVAKVWGRRLKPDGGHYADATKQENYIEDVFDLPTDVQEQIAESAAAGGEFELPDAFARTVATYCYLGTLDVRPVTPPTPQHRSKVHALRFTAVAGPSSLGRVTLQVRGESDAESSDPKRPGDGAGFEHRITLGWRGCVDVSEGRVVRLALWAEGREQLRWGNPGMIARMGDNPAAHLPAGRPLNFDSKVIYGVIGEPVDARNTWTGKGDAPPLGGFDRRPDRNPNAPFDPPARGGGGDVLSRIEGKMDRLQHLTKRRRAAGKTPGELGELMSKFGALLGRGDAAGAERVLDEALRYAERE